MIGRVSFIIRIGAAQKRQIEAAGLSLIECLGEDGRILTEDEDDRQDGLIHYVCIKAG